MTRLAAIAAALIVLVGVLASSSAYATPLAAAPTPVGDVCVETAAPLDAGTLAVKICAKRHSRGLPCTPQPLALPVLGALDLPVSRPVPELVPLLAPAGIGLPDRLFRPPRAAA
jgi:hypothetical protein